MGKYFFKCIVKDVNSNVLWNLKIQWKLKFMITIVQKGQRRVNGGYMFNIILKILSNNMYYILKVDHIFYNLKDIH